MSRNLLNWTFKDVVSFLEQHFFVRRTCQSATGHVYYKGFVDGTISLVEVQFHASKPITPRSLQHDIIPKSRIPVRYWKDWANAGNNHLRKKIQYSGAQRCPE